MSWDSNVLPQLIENIAWEYDEDCWYWNGDIVFHDSGLYKCRAFDHTTGPFDDGVWERIQVAPALYRVTQISNNDSGNFPILISPNDWDFNTVDSETYFDKDVTINPSTGRLNATQYTVENSAITVTKTPTGGWLWS